MTDADAVLRLLDSLKECPAADIHRYFAPALLFGVPPGDPVTLSVVAGLSFVTTVAACVSPALRAARTDPMSALRAD